MPIITWSGKCSVEFAPEVPNKGYCLTKNMYCYRMKLHIPEYRRYGKLSQPEQILFTPASIIDIKVYKQAWSTIENMTLFGDRIYMDHDLNHQMIIEQNSEMYTPVRGVKGMPDIIKK